MNCKNRIETPNPAPTLYGGKHLPETLRWESFVDDFFDHAWVDKSGLKKAAATLLLVTDRTSGTCIDGTHVLQLYAAPHRWLAELFTALRKESRVRKSLLPVHSLSTASPMQCLLVATDGNWAPSEEVWPPDARHAWPTGVWTRPGAREPDPQLWANSTGRRSSLALEGSPSRGRKTLISNLRCLAAIPTLGKAMGVNPDRKSGVVYVRRLSVKLWHSSDNSCSQTDAKCHALRSLGPRRSGQEGGPVVWAAQSLHTLAQASTLERPLQSPPFDGGEKQTGRQQLRVSWTPRAAFDSGKDPRYPTGQLPPALNRAAPDNQVRKERGKGGKGGKGSKEMTRAIRIGSWNVRTMRTGLSDDLRDIDDIRKTAVIDRELFRLNIDIAALQETRLPDSGSLKEDSYTFFWQGKTSEEPREHGVGFAIRNTLLHMIEPPSGGTERIITIRLSTHEGPVNLLSVYAPTLQATSEVKDLFYEQLDSVLKAIPTSEHIFMLGDFNARVGADHESWYDVLGHHGIGKMNENGQRLLELCCYHKLSVTNTYFPNKAVHKTSWRHPRSRHWHQLDLVITRHSSLNSVCNTRAYHSTDCDSDHSLIISTIKLRPKKLHHMKKKGQPRINISKTTLPDKNQKFLEQLEGSLKNTDQIQCAEQMWESLCNTIHSTAVKIYGKKECNNTDWFEAHISVLEPIIEKKRVALLSYKQNPSSQNLQALKAARHEAQQTSRRCANNYWVQLSERIQVASDIGNIRKMYEGIKQATGKTIKKCAPLKAKTGETIIDKEKQMSRWVEHYLELYSQESAVSQDALDSIDDLSVIAELDAEPTMEELSKAIDSMPSWKAPGEDNIPAEVIKCGKPVLLKPLHDLLCLCWKEGKVPHSMRNSKIITLYKNKGDRSDCNSYRGISLLSIVGKVFAKVVLSRLQVLANRVYPESQCGFRAERSTTDMIFSVRQLQEKCREQQKPLYIAFIDLTKAFDLVSRKGLFQLLKKIGCPPQLLSIIISFHEDMKGVVSYDGETSQPFEIRSGVKQGCVLAPTLFGIFFSLLLNFAFGHSTQGVHLHTRSDGKLFNLARLRAKTKVRTVLIRDLLFADDAALTAHVEQELQQMINQFAHACKEFALIISIKKTVVMGQDVPRPPAITLDTEVLEVTDHFTYLGSTVTQNLSLDKELDRRIARAAGVMTKLAKRVWDNNLLTLNTKLQVYRACVLSTLLYGSETWTTYARQENRLESFHLRCLRRILGISWRDRVPNTTVLERSGSLSLHLLLCQRRLRWLGHVYRMEDGRIPKDILYGELVTGRRPVGRPALRFRDVCKRDMKCTDIDPASWEQLAADRSEWRHAVKVGLARGQVKHHMRLDTKRQKRKERLHAQNSSSFLCPNCGRDCHARIGLISHTKRCPRPQHQT
ncbi:hypothetical protein Bbelb_174400 [Branchiostoma belcheri]|nr:hypothetical protein Bbelb_174400 [Branchiostoma belcheri]